MTRVPDVQWQARMAHRRKARRRGSLVLVVCPHCGHTFGLMDIKGDTVTSVGMRAAIFVVAGLQADHPGARVVPWRPDLGDASRQVGIARTVNEAAAAMLGAVLSVPAPLPREPIEAMLEPAAQHMHAPPDRWSSRERRLWKPPVLRIEAASVG